MIKLLVCDDHDMVRTGLIRALQTGRQFQVLAEAATADALLELVAAKTEADVLLLDLNLGGAGLAAGIQLISKVCALNQELPILVVSMHNDPEVVRSALGAGARGYVTKESAFDVLEDAIRNLHQGRRFLDPNLVEPMVMTSPQSQHAPWDAALTKREREVMVMLVTGQRVSEIASGMGLSIKTVSTHKVRLMEKLNIANNADLVKLGVLHKINL
jgi:DNA-binding NarL/FixJ family response regulator